MYMRISDEGVEEVLKDDCRSHLVLLPKTLVPFLLPLPHPLFHCFLRCVQFVLQNDRQLHLRVGQKIMNKQLHVLTLNRFAPV